MSILSRNPEIIKHPRGNGWFSKERWSNRNGDSIPRHVVNMTIIKSLSNDSGGNMISGESNQLSPEIWFGGQMGEFPPSHQTALPDKSKECPPGT